MNEPLKPGSIGWSPDYKGSVEEKLESLRVYPIRDAPDPLLGLVRVIFDSTKRLLTPDQCSLLTYEEEVAWGQIETVLAEAQKTEEGGKRGT